MKWSFFLYYGKEVSQYKNSVIVHISQLLILNNTTIHRLFKGLGKIQIKLCHKELWKCKIILPVTSVFVLAVTGNMTTAIALVTICFTITTSATNSTTATASSAASAERCTAYRTTITAIPGKMTRTVAPITHNSSTHDYKKQYKNNT